MNKTMYKVSQSTGKTQVWWAVANGAEVSVHHGELGGKIQEQTYTAEAKNVGRSNETTAEEQAVVEVAALYEDRVNNKHYCNTEEEAITKAKTCKEPRKVHNFKDHGHKLEGNVYFTMKLNGSRACILGGELFSKIGRSEDIKVDHLREAVAKLDNPYIDCEVYAHGLSLQRIRSAWLKPKKTDKEICDVANKRFGLKGKDRITIVDIAVERLGYNPNEDAEKLQLHVFDIPVEGIPYKERIPKLIDLEYTLHKLDIPCIRVIMPYMIPVEDVEYERNKWYEAGYEGGVVYDPEDLYEFGKRSYTCQKTKPRLDSEALVIDCTEDKSGQGVLLLEWQADEESPKVTFKCKMKGDAESRAFEAQKELVGQWITFSYEELSDSGKPTKGVAHEIRKCSPVGEPLE